VHPRVSAHKLASYIDAKGAGTRERIIRDQKFPPSFQVARYADAEDAIRRSLLATDVGASLLACEQRISSKLVVKPWAVDAKRGCLDAVRLFSSLLPSLDLAQVEATRLVQPSMQLRIEQLLVSVRPVVQLARKRSRDPRVGALLPVFRKEEKLSEKSGVTCAALVLEALHASGVARQEIDPTLCIVVDVFHAQTFAAPVRLTRLRAELKSTCREYAERWPFITAERAA
jgi:hypothetical protein